MPIVTSITTGRGTMTHISEGLLSGIQRVMGSTGMHIHGIIRSSMLTPRGFALSMKRKPKP